MSETVRAENKLEHPQRFFLNGEKVMVRSVLPKGGKSRVSK